MAKNDSVDPVDLGTVAEEPKPKPKMLTDQEMAQVTLNTKKLLDLQPKRHMRLPKATDPKEPNYETVQINGYTYTIMKGADVEVPEEVYNILIRTGRY